MACRIPDGICHTQYKTITAKITVRETFIILKDSGMEQRVDQKTGFCLGSICFNIGSLVQN